MAIIKIKKTKISCFCSSKNIHKNKIIYKSKPKNETDFKIKKKDYFRGYDKCIKCGHYFSNHKYDLEKLYNKNFWGDKTKQGFYKKTINEKRKKEILGINPKTLEYKTIKQTKSPLINSCPKAVLQANTSTIIRT